MRPAPISSEVIRRFVRGQQHPRGVVWFGARSFWGHLRHLVSAAVAAENIDSRDWMTPDTPEELGRRIVEVLGGGADRGASLVEQLDRDLYVDFVADTGDDVSVSRAVAGLVFADYELPDPDRPGEIMAVPRGDVLLFGGDTAYPVATAEEILDRVIVPWNEVLREIPDDGRRRVLLGIPGNHDWYDGLDGFARMFRRRPPDPEHAATGPTVSPMMALRIAAWAQEFLRGGAVDKPPALTLSGYAPVQNASHFALRLAPGVDLLAVDRQLTDVDSRQRAFLRERYRSDPTVATLVVLPDPVYFFGAPSKTGTQMVDNMQLDLQKRETFVLSGDIHHYERLVEGSALHVIAGGGGAFLHPARVAKGGLTPAATWPSAAQSRFLLRGVPWKLAMGRSGFLPHIGLGALFFPVVALGWRMSTIANVVLIAGIFSLVGGAARRRAVLPLALGAGLVTALIPFAAARLVEAGARIADGSAPFLFTAGLTLALAAFAGTFVFGAFLVLLTLLGYEHMQALTVLDHPGFKHFLRLRVRADGSGIDGWCIGATDPLRPGQRPELADFFTWRPSRGRAPPDNR